MIPGLANSSGPTHVVANLTEQLAKLGCAVTVFHVQYDDIEAVWPDPSLVETSGFPLTSSRRWGYSRSLGKALRENVVRFDIVHMYSVWMYPTMAAARCCPGSGVPYLVRPEGSFRRQALSRRRILKNVYYRLLERRTLGGASAIQAVSELEAKELRGLKIGVRVCVIPNGVSVSDLSIVPPRAEARVRLGIDPEAKVVLYLGRLHPIKGLDLLTAAFARVLRLMPEAKLLIVGPAAPGYSEEVANMVKQHGIEQQTTLTGELRGQDKWAAYRAADVFVLPSRSENFGIVVGQAMACGVPVVVSREAPWQDVGTYKAGRWVGLDPEEIAESIIEILENPDLAKQMGENGRALVREKYTWDNIARQMLR